MPTFTKTFISTILLLFFISCRNPESTKIEREDQPDLYVVEEEDTAMVAATASAKLSFNRFDSALRSQNGAFSAFAIKQRFERAEGSEHLWVGAVYFKDGNYYGSLANEPLYISGLDMGDSVKLDPAAMSDWKYQIGKRVIGGYTIRLLRNSMTEAERKQFDQEYGLSFD